MESMKLNPQPLLPPPPPYPQLQPQPPTQNYIVLPLPLPFNFSFSNYNPTLLKKLFKIFFLLLILSSILFLLWPSDPNVKIARLKLRHVKIHTRHRVAVDISLDAKVRITNKAMYSMDYSGLNVQVGYRGKPLGHVVSGGGHVSAKGVSYKEVRVEFNGVEVSELIHLLEDLASGFITFDTVSQVDGFFSFFFFRVPYKGKISCEILVNVKHQKITGQNCYRDLSKEKDKE
ncbi:uncharacterized protein LOC130814046 isoform X2 [Amaranthus tricolor]|uniref:uncharacterized protein LOC130814046 isoform X2 n=1 Tax=Amaranthus tricolor TaxID=29722 RepID=UPI002584BD0B|nr:uncharacterized protein LOC130814046 isoform X2 [Amaranthus tricolor]